MADDTDVLLSLLNQYWDEIRHTENQRATLTNLIILIASAIIGLMVQKGLNKDFLPLAVLLILIGVYGTAMTLKLYERYSFIQTRLEHVYHHLEQLHPNTKILDIRKIASEEHEVQFPRLVKLRVHRLWLTLHIAISLSGIALVLVLLFL